MGIRAEYTSFCATGAEKNIVLQTDRSSRSGTIPISLSLSLSLPHTYTISLSPLTPTQRLQR